MDAREFLEQLKKLDRMIENKLIEKEQWKTIAMGMTPQMNGERVQSSGSQQKMADAVCKYMDMDAEIDKCIDELVDNRLSVISVIEQLDADEYDVLHKIYVQYIPMKDVVKMLGKSKSWVRTVHERALEKVQGILDKC